MILIILQNVSKNVVIHFWLLQPSGFTEREVSHVYKKTKRALQRARLVPAGAAHKNLNTFLKEVKLQQKLSSFR